MKAMKYTKGNLAGQSRSLTTPELLRVMAGLRATPKWKSRARRGEEDVRKFFYPRLVDFTHVDLIDPAFPDLDHGLNIYCAGGIDREPSTLNWSLWTGASEGSFIPASFHFSGRNEYPRRPEVGFERKISVYVRPRDCSVCCYGSDDVPGDGPRRMDVFQRMLDAAGYEGRLRVDRIVSCYKYAPLWAFVVEKLDPAVVTYFIANDPRRLGAYNKGPFVTLGSFQHDDFPKYPVLEDMVTGKWLCGKDSSDISIYHDCPAAGERFVPAQNIDIENLSLPRVLEILRAWLGIFFGETQPVITKARFGSLVKDWPHLRERLTVRFPGPWVFDNIFYSRGREEDVEGLVTRGVAPDCLVPLCYWRASQGPRLLLDAVANADGTWELWAHGAKTMGLKAAATVRAELSAATGIPDLFPPPQEFPWGGWCDLVISS